MMVKMMVKMKIRRIKQRNREEQAPENLLAHFEIVAFSESIIQ